MQQLVYPSFILCHSISTHDNLIKFCRNNGKQYVTITTAELYNPDVVSYIRHMFLKSTVNNSTTHRMLHTRFVHPKQITKSLSEMDITSQQDFLVVVSSSNYTNWSSYLNLLSKAKIKSSLLVIIGSIDADKLEEIKGSINDSSKNAYFYMLYNDKGSNESTWNKVITLQHYHQSVIDTLSFAY